MQSPLTMRIPPSLSLKQLLRTGPSKKKVRVWIAEIFPSIGYLVLTGQNLKVSQFHEGFVSGMQMLSGIIHITNQVKTRRGQRKGPFILRPSISLQNGRCCGRWRDGKDKGPGPWTIAFRMKNVGVGHLHCHSGTIPQPCIHPKQKKTG